MISFGHSIYATLVGLEPTGPMSQCGTWPPGPDCKSRGWKCQKAQVTSHCPIPTKHDELEYQSGRRQANLGSGLNGDRIALSIAD
jgi:hypothetical protein